MSDYERLKSAILRYARHHPLDLRTLREFQEDLLSIAGKPHQHRNRGLVGDDSCLLCGRDLSDDVHDLFNFGEKR
jgi:hypothetical protein